MKKILFSILALLAIATTARAQNVAINDGNFPDANFRNFLLAQPYGKDKILTSQEINDLQTLNIRLKDIKSLSGIRYLSGLKELDCGCNKLYDGLDLSGLTALQTLKCDESHMGKLNVSGCTGLKEVYCYNNYISGEDMTAFVNSLPKKSGATLYVCNISEGQEHNVILKEQVAIAKGKGWTVKAKKYYMGPDGFIPLFIEYDGADGVIINEANFPDENFRKYLCHEAYGTDGVITAEEFENWTGLSVMKTEIKSLKGISYFKNLQRLSCYGNQLTELDVSGLSKLTFLECYNNCIKGNAMQALVESLPQIAIYKGSFIVIDTQSDTEQNVITKPQVAIAKGKRWNVYEHKAVGTRPEYEGSDPEGIKIDETNFPDATFRNYVSDKTIDKDEDGYLSDEEIAAVTSISVKNKGIADLTGIEYFTALTKLFCTGNQLTALDVSANTELTYLECSENQLTALEVSQNKKLNELWCDGNQIKGDKMLALVNSLPTVTSGTFGVINTKNSNEGNVCTKSQVDIAKNKNWKEVYDYNGGSLKEYAGSDDTPTDPKTLAVTFTKATTLLTELSKQDLNVLAAVVFLAQSGLLSNYSVVDNTSMGVRTITLKKGRTPRDSKILFVMKPNKGIAVPSDVTSADNINVTLTDDLRKALEKADLATQLAGYKAIQVKFDIGTPTAIDASLNDNGQMTNESWYTIDGVKLQGEPTKKGVYIIKGKKVKK